MTHNTTPATVLITGGTGLVGSRLTEMLLQTGSIVHIFTRNPSGQTGTGRLRFFAWNPAAGSYDAAALAGVTAIINLAGAGVADKRWTANRKQEIVDSRVQAGALLVQALRETPNQVQTIIQASAQGWYGADTPEIVAAGGFEETAPPFNDFLGETCRQWEAAIAPVEALEKRLTIFRIGIVMSHKGGYLKAMRPPLRFGIAPVFGNGRQMVSWIHIDDLCGMMLQAVESPNWKGVFNAGAPQPVTQKALMTTIAKARGKWFVKAPVPAFVLKVLAGEMSIEILKSTTMNTAKIQAAGFVFRYPEAALAMGDLSKS